MTTRRNALAALGAGIAGIGVAVPATMNPSAVVRSAERKTYVLVHGTWHGGWVWQRVAERLRAQGHRVYTPTCTGCGERLHLSRPEVGLDTHITDVANVIEYEELERVILVGHSFAGFTITGVADRLRPRIRRIVFFDAFVPTAERPAAIMPGPDGKYAPWWEARKLKFIDGHRMNFWDEYKIDMLVPPADTANVELLKRRITTHPYRQWTDRLELRNGGWDGVPRSYVQPTQQAYEPSSDFMIGPARGAGWQFLQLPCTRNGMLTHPDEVAACFAALS